MNLFWTCNKNDYWFQDGVRLAHQKGSAYKDPSGTSQILEDMLWVRRRKNMKSRDTGKGQQPFRPAGKQGYPRGAGHQGSTVHYPAYLGAKFPHISQWAFTICQIASHLCLMMCLSMVLMTKVTVLQWPTWYCSLPVPISYCPPSPWLVPGILVSLLYPELSRDPHFRPFMLAIPCLVWSPRYDMGDTFTLHICSAVTIPLKSSTCPHSPLLVLLSPLFPCLIFSLLLSLTNTLYPLTCWNTAQAFPR